MKVLDLKQLLDNPEALAAYLATNQAQEFSRGLFAQISCERPAGAYRIPKTRFAGTANDRVHDHVDDSTRYGVSWRVVREEQPGNVVLLDKDGRFIKRLEPIR